jgi:hypothetical protein
MPSTENMQENKMLRRLALISAKVWIVILVGSLLVARPVWTSLHRPTHLNEIAAECGSVNFFIRLQIPDPAGNRIVYRCNTENGVGVFLYDDATGKSQLIDTNRARLLGWSPDGSSFAYVRTLVAPARPVLVICRPATGKTEMLPCALASWNPWPNTDPICAWLTSESFVYFVDPMELHWVRKQTDGHWLDTVQSATSQVKTTPLFLTALSDHTIAWCEDSTLCDTLWTLDVTSSLPPVELFRLENVKNGWGLLTSAPYSPENRQFLVSRAGTGSESLWRLTPGDSSPENPSLLTTDRVIRGAKWINGGKGYAYLRQDGSLVSDGPLVVQADLSAKPVVLFPSGNATHFGVSPNGKRLFIVGVASNEFAPSLWKYDVASASLQCIKPCSERPLRFVRRFGFIHKTIVSSSGRKISFDVDGPPGFMSGHHRRYPLVFLTSWTGEFASPFANCGVVSAWVQRNDKWGDDMLEVYKSLAEAGMVDTKRVFICTASGETSEIGDFCSKHPSFWKGMIIMNPSGFSDARALTSGWRTPKLLISAGEEEGQRNTDQIRKYQQEAAKVGVKSEVYIQRAEGHSFQSQSGKSERMQEVMNFIFDN